MSCQTATLSLVESDVLPQLNVTYQNEAEDGTISAVDLTPYVSITLRVRQPSGRKFERAAVIDDAAAGEFHFVWQAGDLEAGISNAEITFTSTTGDETYPSDGVIRLVIRERV